jgi:TM2 domain-containing membrane protein YozV
MDKRIIGAALSFLFPGLGQFYVGHKFRGIIFFIGTIALVYISSILPIDGFSTIIFFIAAADAYNVSPKVDVHIPMGIKMGLIGIGLTLLAMGVTEWENELAVPMMIFLLIAALIFFSMMHSGQRENMATLRVRDAIAKMGFSPAETSEITNDVVCILKASGDSSLKKYTSADGPLSRMSDVIVSKSNWADFSPEDLSQAIRTVLEIRDRRQQPPLT